jgi:hypothetical protein
MEKTSRRENPPIEARVCRAIRLLAEGVSADEVARVVRVRPATLAAWQAGDDFRVLLGCMVEAGQVHDALEALDDLTPGAIAALRRALEGDDMALAVRAAHEVLERVGPLANRQIEQTIRVEYVNPDHQAVSTSPWSDRNPPSSGAFQGGGLRSPLREDGGGQDSDG